MDTSCDIVQKVGQTGFPPFITPFKKSGFLDPGLLPALFDIAFLDFVIEFLRMNNVMVHLA